jgi:hypothetical protein
MLKNQQTFILFVTFFSINIHKVSAQNTTYKYEIGGGISSFIYQGDLAPSRFGSYKTIRLGVSLFGNRILNQSFSFRLNLVFGNLKGDESKYYKPEYRKQRNFNFSTLLTEVAAILIWNPLGENYADKGMSPYLLGGAGIGVLNIKRDWSNFNAAYFGEDSNIPELITLDAGHSLPQWTPVIPLGIGIRYVMSNTLALYAESSYRLAYTDYLDGFSRSVNPEKNDHYQITTIGTVYRIGKKNKLGCPVIKY